MGTNSTVSIWNLCQAQNQKPRRTLPEIRAGRALLTSNLEIWMFEINFPAVCMLGLQYLQTWHCVHCRPRSLQLLQQKQSVSSTFLHANWNLHSSIFRYRVDFIETIWCLSTTQGCSPYPAKSKPCPAVEIDEISREQVDKSDCRFQD